MTDGIVERRFRVGDIPGILWLPASASPTHPVPLILAGLPGGPLGLDRSYPRMFERARSAAHAGLATVTIESPGSGGRAMPTGVDDARTELRRAVGG